MDLEGVQGWGRIWSKYNIYEILKEIIQTREEFFYGFKNIFSAYISFHGQRQWILYLLYEEGNKV